MAHLPETGLSDFSDEDMYLSRNFNVAKRHDEQGYL